MFRIGPALLAIVLSGASSHAAVPKIRVVDFEEVTVTGATAKRITQAIDEAEAAGEQLVLIELDTPGGEVGAVQTIVKAMLGAEVPVVVWVGPSGSRAASAGFFILIAADVATMAPGTRTGAASTVYGTQKSEEDDVLLKKMNKDAAALLRSIAERRGRNIEAAEAAVMAADTWSEAEALKAGLIDLVAADRASLLGLLHGREVTRFDGEKIILATENAEFVTTDFDFRQRVAEMFINPAVAFILLMIGLTGLWVEFSHPGLIFPAVIGVLALILFAFAAQALPTSVAGLLLILLAIALFVLEIKVTSYGMLTLGGAVCLVGGSLLLFDGPIPELRVPPGLVIPVALAVAIVMAVVLRFAIKAQQSRVATGVEGLQGQVGTVTQALDPRGKVFVHGELWDAVTNGEAMAEGSQVRVLEARDMTLKVEPADGPARGGG